MILKANDLFSDNVDDNDDDLKGKKNNNDNEKNRSQMKSSGGGGSSGDQQSLDDNKRKDSTLLQNIAGFFIVEHTVLHHTSDFLSLSEVIHTFPINIKFSSHINGFFKKRWTIIGITQRSGY